jgi:hypothetical protein
MTRILLLAATAVSLIAPATADAGNRHKHHYYRHHHYGAWNAPVYGPRPYRGGWQAPVGLQTRTPGPPWAMPNECYTDEGYGRYSPCDRRR